MITHDKSGEEIWVTCDKCGLTMFGGFAGASMPDVMRPYKMHGWMFGKQVVCQFCNEEGECKNVC